VHKARTKQFGPFESLPQSRLPVLIPLSCHRRSVDQESVSSISQKNGFYSQVVSSYPQQLHYTTQPAPPEWIQALIHHLRSVPASEDVPKHVKLRTIMQRAKEGPCVTMSQSVRGVRQTRPDGIRVLGELSATSWSPRAGVC